MTKTHQLEATLRALKLGGMLDTIDARLAQAAAGELGHIEFLQVLCEDELTRRDAAGLHPPGARGPLRVHDAPSRSSTSPTTPSSPPPRSATWPPCASSRPSESVILHGPVGVGKTMIAQALGHRACRHGYSCAFTKTSRLVGDLAGGHADRSWETRLKAWTRPTVLILDDFAMREFTPSPGRRPLRAGDRDEPRRA